MKEILQKTKKRLQGMKHIDAKDLALQTMLPLFERFQRQLDELIDTNEHNFKGLYETLHVSKEDQFLDTTYGLVKDLNSFIDEIFVAAGFLVPNPDQEVGGFLPTETMPPAQLEKLGMFTVRGLAWFEQLDAVRAAAEEESLEDDEFDDDDDDDDDLDDDDDGYNMEPFVPQEGDPSGPVVRAAPDSDPESPDNGVDPAGATEDGDAVGSSEEKKEEDQMPPPSEPEQPEAPKPEASNA